MGPIHLLSALSLSTTLISAEQVSPLTDTYHLYSLITKVLFISTVLLHRRLTWPCSERLVVQFVLLLSHLISSKTCCQSCWICASSLGEQKSASVPPRRFPQNLSWGTSRSTSPGCWLSLIVMNWRPLFDFKVNY